MFEVICMMMLTSCLEVVDAPTDGAEKGAEAAAPRVVERLGPDDAPSMMAVGSNPQLVRRERPPLPRPGED